MSAATHEAAAPAGPDMDGIVVLSRRMLECAEHGDWDAVTAHERERRERMERYFAAPARPPAGGLAEAIREIVAIDQRIIALGQARRDEIAASLRTLEKGRRGTETYRRGGR